MTELSIHSAQQVSKNKSFDEASSYMYYSIIALGYCWNIVHSCVCAQLLCMCVSAGYSDGHIPEFDHDDTIELFVLKAPVWEFKFGRLLADVVS